jgi:hypothetical protein
MSLSSASESLMTSDCLPHQVPFDDRALVLLMHHLDSTGDGKVNYAEFAEALGH